MWILAPIVRALVWVFASRIGLFIFQALAWAGLTWGTAKVVIQPTLDLLHGYLTGMSGSSSLGTAAFQWIGVLKFDVACTMIMSAYVTKLGVSATKVFLKKTA